MKRVLLLTLALAAGAAQAQTWPQKPMIFLNPFPAGGGTDTFARPIAAKLSQQLGEQALIENQGGAGGTVGAANAAKRAPDGYNWFFGAVHHTIAESLYTRLNYSLEKDFEPVTVAAFVPNVVVVHPKHKDTIKSLKDLIDYAKANPDKLNYGSAGSGTTHHLSVELFKTMTGTKLVHVPYKGAGPLMVDMLAGQVDLAFDGMGTSSTQIKAGRLIPLAITSVKRAAERADRAGSGRARLRGAHLVRHLGDQGDTAGDQGPDVQGDRQGDGAAGSEAHLGRAGCGSRRHAAGGDGKAGEGRDREVGEGRQRRRRQG
jgi:tripartite-type tricarboxylate transporter receptor subunit TctC